MDPIIFSLISSVLLKKFGNIYLLLIFQVLIDLKLMIEPLSFFLFLILFAMVLMVLKIFFSEKNVEEVELAMVVLETKLLSFFLGFAFS